MARDCAWCCWPGSPRRPVLPPDCRHPRCRSSPEAHSPRRAGGRSPCPSPGLFAPPARRCRGSPARLWRSAGCSCQIHGFCRRSCRCGISLLTSEARLGKIGLTTGDRPATSLSRTFFRSSPPRLLTTALAFTRTRVVGEVQVVPGLPGGRHCT